jgi:uncharacterized metal-binding protein
MTQCSCQCDCNNPTTPLIFACSGAADVGELADRVARQLDTAGHGDFACLAAAAAGYDGTIASIRGADRVITVDGCAKECARKVIEPHVGPGRLVKFDLGALGFPKGKTPPTLAHCRRAHDAILANLLASG